MVNERNHHQLSSIFSMNSEIRETRENKRLYLFHPPCIVIENKPFTDRQQTEKNAP